MARIAAKIKNDPQFQTLLAVFNDDAKALEAFNRIQPKPESDTRAAQLRAAGFTAEQVELALAEEAVEVEVPPTNKEIAEALVTDRGFTWAKGRVYAGPLLAEAIVRCHRGGKAEIVPSSGVGRTKGVLVYKEESGDVALQNLTKAEA